MEEKKMIKMYYEKDCNLDLLNGKTVAVVGYGSQGHAHALNLKESGVDVVVGLRKDSPSRAKAEAQGLRVAEVSDAVKQAQLVMVLLPDERQADVYYSDIAPNLNDGDYINSQ